jgi:NAD(P)H-dependent FMN reductase
MKPIHIMAICGSLRSRSSNLSLLKATEALAGSRCEFTFFKGLGELPHFNPDLDLEVPPKPVAALRALLAEADAIVICTPEYVHGLPGSLKNAIDWTVSSGEWMEKPVLILNASPISHFAHDALVEITTTLMAKVVARTIPLLGNKLDTNGMLANETIREGLEAAINDLITVFLEN